MKFRFERRASRAIKPTWGHGRYLDPWTLIHLLTGFLLGIGALWFAFPLQGMLITIVAVTTLYEAFEMWLGIVEDWQNSLLDVVVAVIGAWIAYQLFSGAEKSLQIFVFLGVGGITLILFYYGWRAYLRRRLSRR